MVIFGSRLYGKVDEAPTLFHVATKFGHLNFVPLIPLQSYLVLGKVGDSLRVREIPLCWKSVFVGWLQGLSVVGGIISLLGTLSSLQSRFVEKQAQALPDGILFVLCLGVFLYLRFSGAVRRASYERACELGAIADLNPEGKTILDFAYGRISEEEARQAMKGKVEATP